MDRTQTTKLLTDIRKYYAQEVCIDHGTANVKRIDVVQFTPANVFSISGIESGYFTCYEVKSCVEDVYSGHGLNFLGEENYILCNMETYKKLIPDINSGYLTKYIREHYPESSYNHYGIIVPVPNHIDCRRVKAVHDEFENPTKFEGFPYDWKLYKIQNCRPGGRNRSLAEMLFCMLRAKHNYTNQ